MGLCSAHSPSVASILSYDGSVTDIAVNYTVLCVVLLAVLPARPTPLVAVGCGLGLVATTAFQVLLCVCVGCTGVSIIWNVVAGGYAIFLVCRGRRPFTGQCSLLSAVAAALAVDVYYACRAEALTTAAHVCALVLGAVVTAVATRCSSVLAARSSASSAQAPLLSASRATQPAVPDDGRLHAELVRDGYAIVRGFLDPTQLAEVRANASRFVAHLPELVTKGTVPSVHVMYDDVGVPETLKQVQQLQTHDAFFGRLMERLRAVASAALGEPAVEQNMQWFNKPPVGAYAPSDVHSHSQPTPPHQDGYYWCLAEEREAGKLGGLTMWLALDAADESNGCMWYVCGSVSDGLRPHAFSGVKGFSQTLADYGPADERREAAMCAQPGDLLMHSALLVHRAGANRSERPRRAIGAIFYAESARVDHARHEARAKEIAARSAHLAGQK